ncbi:MAG: hypothetical protein ACP5O0_02135 [Acidimicrobiales bacterium]
MPGHRLLRRASSEQRRVERRIRERNATRPTLLILGAITLASCGGASSSQGSQATNALANAASSSSNSGSTSQTAGSSLFNLTRLSSLTNYSYVYTALNQGYTFKQIGRVHSLTDWSVTSTSPAVTIYDVNGHGYSVVGTIRSTDQFKTPDGTTHLAGEVVWAGALIDDTHIAQVRINEGGSCQVAGVLGTEVTVRSPLAARSIFGLDVHACIDKSSGALLSISQGVVSDSAPTAAGLKGSREQWAVTAVGGVGPIHLPPSSAAASTSTSTSSASSGGAQPTIPSSFPPALPTPPGTLKSAVAVSPSKWFLLLSESVSNASQRYVRTLQGRGFHVTSATNAPTVSVVSLTDTTYSVEIEQAPSIGGSGSVATLAVTVTTGS